MDDVGAEKPSGLKGQEASLGCGSLILIAIIVMIFSGHNDKTRLEPVLKKLDAIENRLKAMDRRLERLQVLTVEK